MIHHYHHINDLKRGISLMSFFDTGPPPSSPTDWLTVNVSTTVNGGGVVLPKVLKSLKIHFPRAVFDKGKISDEDEVNVYVQPPASASDGEDKIQAQIDGMMQVLERLVELQQLQLENSNCRRQQQQRLDTTYLPYLTTTVTTRQIFFLFALFDI